jgi:hypothetical protein
MQECKPTKKNGPTTQTSLSSISRVLNLLLNAFNLPKKPAPTIPPFLLLAGAELRPGMSARDLSANIISKMESKGGTPMGDIFGDGPNAITATMLIQSEEQIKHIQTKAKVSSIIKPGSVQITVVGSNAGGPLVATGSNTTMTENSGIMT